MPTVPLPQSVWKMLFTDFCQYTQSSCAKNETEIAEYTAPVIRKRVGTHLWPVVDKDPAVTGGCEVASNAGLNLLHCLVVTKGFSSDGSVSLRVYGQGSWCCCMVQGWAWTGYLQSVVPLPAGGAPWPLLMPSRSCSLMGYIALHEQLRKI